MFEHFSNFNSSKLAKRLRFNNPDAPSDDEYPKVSIHMAKKDTSKQLAPEPENSTIGVYMGTHNCSSVTRPLNYRALGQGHGKPKEHSAIVELQLSSSSGDREVHSVMATTCEEMV